MTYENEIFFTELVSTSVSKRYVKLPVCGFNYPTAASRRVAFFFFQVDGAVQLSSGASSGPLLFHDISG